jgi:phosphoglycerate dehydrogenase-like enzyme
MPHVSAVTVESRTAGIDQLATNVLRVLDGDALPAHVDALAE